MIFLIHSWFSQNNPFSRICTVFLRWIIVQFPCQMDYPFSTPHICYPLLSWIVLSFMDYRDLSSKSPLLPGWSVQCFPTQIAQEASDHLFRSLKYRIKRNIRDSSTFFDQFSGTKIGSQISFRVSFVLTIFAEMKKVQNLPLRQILYILNIRKYKANHFCKSH